jgi:DNA topoisomerase IB/2'-5' RNA ligase
MDVPDMRRDVSKPDNVAWLLRNLRARNDDHPRIDDAMSMLKVLMRAKRAAGVPKKYEHIDFTPPESAAKAAEKGLEYREKASPSNKGGLTPAEASEEGIGSGVQRAVNLKNRNTLSPDTIKQMHGFFSRHEKNKGVAPEHKSEPWNDKGNVSWLLWGGDAAKSWVDKVLGQMETADEKEKAVKKASVEGQGTEVGFFIPLSADLASQYGVKPEDTSPPHVTFLYVGRVPADREAEFLAVARNVLQSAPPVFGVLNGVDSFVHEDKNRRVLYSRVSFSHDLRPLRDRLWDALTKAGFDVQHSFKNFTPHVTLEYRDGVNDAVWHGAAPSGSWECKTIEVWGLPQKYVLSFGAGRGRKASLDTVTYGNLTVEEEAEALSLSDVFTSDVLEQIPHRPFPANTSPETKAELAYLMRLQNTVRPYMAARVRLTDENPTETLEAYCSAHGLPTGGGVLEVTQAARTVLLQLKRLYNRPRPYQVAAYMEPGFHPLSSTSVHTPAYPSGHSAQAVLAALLLSDMHPAHREAFMALAKEVGQHRMVGGFHFPSDVAYGEEVGRVLYGCLARASVRTAAAKYKDKKQVPKADGSGKTTVYVYSERQVANRQREKAERLEDFKPALADLRAQVKKDLDSDDPKKGLIALAVGLIDATYERVGNDESADKGHYGVTGWLRKHVTFKGNRAVIRYVGKSGVKHEKSVDDEVLVGALKDCCGNKDGEEQVLSLGKHAVSSDDVNEYLKPYGITAKDLRGLHANREMQERLRAIRSKGPKLPRPRKERDPILKDEFKQALEAAAEAVGHEPATLRKQYLVPGLEEAYMKDGTVPRDLTASTRVASLYLRATKSDAEREDEEAERLIKPEPKYKPPRGDLRRRRVETEGDADPDKAQDDKDRSQNYKDAAVRSAVQVATAAWLFKTAREAPPSEKSDKPSAEGSGKGDTSALQAQAKKEFEAYEKAHPDTELDASDFLKRLQEKAKRKAEKSRDGEDGEDGEDDGGDDESADTKHFEQQEKDRKAKRVSQLVEKVGRDWDATKGSLPLSDENRNRISSAIAKYTPAQRAEFAAAFSSAREQAIAAYTDKGYNSESVEAAILSMGTKIKSTDPKKIAAHAAKAIFADRVLLNPMLLTPDEPLSDEDEEGTADTAKATERVGQAMTRFTNASKRERELMSKRIDEAIAEAPQGSAKHEDLLAVKFSLDVTNALRANERDDDADDEDDDGKEKPLKPPKGMSKVQFGLLQHFSGDPEKSSELLGLSFRASRKDKTATEDTRKFVREATGSMKPEQINALLPEEMQSVSLAVKGWLKEIASDRADSLKSRGKSTKKEDAEIAEYDARMKEIGERLGERLSDVVAETIDRKVDPKKTKELATEIKGLSEAYKSSGATKSGKGSDKDFFARLQAMFKKFLGKGGASPRSATASLALPRYGFPLR